MGLYKDPRGDYVKKVGGRLLTLGGGAMHVVIDLFGDDDTVISVPPEETPEEIKKREALRQRALEEIFRRAPQPQLEIVPITPSKR